MKTSLIKVMVIVVLAIMTTQAWSLVSEYSFASSLGTYNEINGGTVLGSNANDDESFNAIPLGFSFSYNGVQYTQISIQTDAFLAFGPTVLNSNLAISSATGTNNIVSAFNRDLMSRADGELSYNLSGTAPNRVFTVQWKNYRRIVSQASNDVMNFQIRLEEAGNVVDFAYGSFTLTTITTAQTVQVGLRGDSNTDFNNRSTTTNWSETLPGTAANASCLINATVFPPNGLHFKFAPQVAGPPLPAQIFAPANGATNVALEANLSWSSGGGVQTGYKVYLGTDNPPTNLLNGVSQTGSVYDPPTNFLFNTQYFWKIVPYNTYGDAVGCPVWSFTTLADPTVASFPYLQNFDAVTLPGIPLGWSVLNLNADSYTWISVSDASANTAPQAMRIRYNESLAMNDWLISPPVQFSSNSLYKIKFYYKAGNSSYTEKLALYLGDAPTAAALTTQLFVNNNINSTNYETVEIELPVLAGGIKYLGFKGFSDAGMYQLFIDSFSIVEIGPEFQINPTVHDFGSVNIGQFASQNFTITNTGGGTLILQNITLSGSPMFSLTGLPALPANLGMNVNTTFGVVFTPTSAGEQTATLSITDNLTRSVHNISLSGLGFLVEDFNPPTALAALVTGNDVHLSWSLPAGNLRFTPQIPRSLLGYNVFRDTEQIGTVASPDILFYDDPDLAEGVYQYTVTAYYTSGESVPAGPISVTVNEQLIPPNQLTAGVNGNDVTLNWVSPHPPVIGQWLSWANDIIGNTVGTNAPAIFMVAQRWDQTDLATFQGDSIVRMKFVPAYGDCVYTAKIWTGGSAVDPGTLVYSQVVNNPIMNEWNQVILSEPLSIPSNGDLWVGYQVNTQGGYPASVDFGPAVEGKGNMMFFNGAWTTLSQLSSSLVCNWLIAAYIQEGVARKHDVPAPIVESPSSEISSGSLSYDPSFRLAARRAERSLTGFKVYRDGALVATFNDTSVSSFADMNLPDGNYLYGVTAVYSSGESLPVEVNVNVNESLAPVLFADSFEAYPDFAIAFAPWTLLDLDQSLTYGISGFTFPGNGDPTSFMVFNPSATIPPAASVSAYNGSKMLTSFAARIPPNNDWLITPRIHLGTNCTLRFYAKSQTSVYGLERFKVGLSTLAQINPLGFQYISGVNPLEAPTAWTEYTYDLSGYSNQAVYIAVRCISNDAFLFYLDKFSVQSEGGSVSGDDQIQAPAVTSLKGNSPNPFTASTRITYHIAEKSSVSVEIYNLKGQLVRKLCQAVKDGGEHDLVWDATDDHGNALGSGVYFCRLTAGKSTFTTKMLLLK